MSSRRRPGPHRPQRRPSNHPDKPSSEGARPKRRDSKSGPRPRPGHGAPAPRSIRAVTPPETKRPKSSRSQRIPLGPIDPQPSEQRRTRRFWPRKLKFTREGKYFLGITLGVGFAAINTGNNLLYLMLGMMLSLIIVSGVMSELSLRTLTVKRRLPARAQVGRSHLVEIEVYNNKTRVPSYAIEVEDLRAGQPADKRCFFLKISPRSTQIAAYRRTPLRRGLERHTGFRIATRFPFGLFEKSREVDSPDELLIYPAVDPVRLPHRGHGENAGDVGPLGRGYGEEIYTVRKMRDGDDPRDIYWRKSTYERVLRERAREMRHEVELTLDVFRPPPPLDADATASAQHRNEHGEQFERRIRELASQSVAHIKRGDRVIVTTNDGDRVSSDAVRGIDPVLRFLALVRQLEGEADPRRERRVGRRRRRRRGAAA
jgi:uncharacterized protein (DUF58 family)